MKPFTDEAYEYLENLESEFCNGELVLFHASVNDNLTEIEEFGVCHFMDLDSMPGIFCTTSEHVFDGHYGDIVYEIIVKTGWKDILNCNNDFDDVYYAGEAGEDEDEYEKQGSEKHIGSWTCQKIRADDAVERGAYGIEEGDGILILHTADVIIRKCPITLKPQTQAVEKSNGASLLDKLSKETESAADTKSQVKSKISGTKQKSGLSF